MSEQIKSKIIDHLKSGNYQPTKPRGLAAEAALAEAARVGVFAMRFSWEAMGLGTHLDAGLVSVGRLS